MANTQYRMRYGQYTSEVAQQLSIDYLGTVVYSGKTREIWVDGKCIAANFQGSVDALEKKIGDLNNLTTATKENLVAAINELDAKIKGLNNSFAKAEMTTDNGASFLTIFGTKQTEGLVENDESESLVVNLVGEYDGKKNPIATKLYVDGEIKKILGSESLEKTLDTIKEIQDELLKNVKYHVVKGDSSESDVEIIEVYRIEGDSDGEVVYVDEDASIVAYETSDGIVYEEGYSNLTRTNAFDTLIAGVEENKENIENLENKNFVAKISVEEEADNDFVTATSETSTDEYGAKSQEITIGVKYGTFKTGHGNVMDADSTAYVDGIATVKGVQDYVEERISWDEFVTDANEVTENINNSVEDGGTYPIKNDSELNESIVIKNNN